MTRRAWEDFPPHVLREYALLADGERGALCGPRGDIAWLCAPRWDSDAVLSGLVGGPGVYAVTPTEPCVWGGYYEAGTLIWRNRWITSNTTIVCRDALAYPGHSEQLVLLRRIEAGAEDTKVSVMLDLRAGFGAHAMSGLRRHRDSVTAQSGNLHIRWGGVADVHRAGDGRLSLDIVVPAGAHHDLTLEITPADLPLELPEPDVCWSETEHAWHEAVPTFESSVAPRDARHAYAVMRGLTRPNGGMVAAATLGLPERAQAGRNYDYRYAWLRDQSYAGIAAAVDEPLPLLDDAVAFTSARLMEYEGTIAPAYRVDGRPLPSQVTLPLPGYPGGRDVVGNWVNGQFQLDALGDMLTLFAAAAGHDHLDSDGHRAVQIAVGVIETKWNEPEAGIWELHDAWWTQSRLACVAGLRSMAAHLPSHEGARLSSLADSILARTSQLCLDPSGAWLRQPGQAGTDASLLLPPVHGALPGDDPRTLATLDAVGRDLTQDGYIYRFHADDQPLGDAEGAFLLCGFTMALAHWHQGNLTEAFRWFERTRAAAGPPGLLAEEYDVRQRQLRGNLPQAFVHAALLETAQRLASPPCLVRR